MEKVVVQRLIDTDHPAFDGHFPGRPVLPGVVLLSEVARVINAIPELASAVGEQPMLASAKFVAPVQAGCALRIELSLGPAGLAFEVSVEAAIVAKGHFQLQAGRVAAQ